MPEAFEHISRARILLDQHQYQRAEDALRAALAEHPDDAWLMSLLAMTLVNLERLVDAEQAARRGVELEPDSEFSWYTLAMVLAARDKGKAAIDAANRAIELEPDDPDNWWVLGAARLCENDLKGVLDATEHGLRLDPESHCLITLRDRALVRLGRSGSVEEARRTLARDPQSDIAHDNLGWALLNAGDHRAAVEHFREALRIDPNFKHAREGILEAMKARSWLYRPALRYSLASQRQSLRTQYIVIIVFVAVMVLSRRMITWTPSLGPAILVFRSLVFAACAFLLFAGPLFNLVLRADPLGRHALTPWQSRMATLLGVSIIPTAIAAVGAGVTQSRDWLRLLTVLLAACFAVAILTDLEDPVFQRRAVALLVAIAIAVPVMLINYFVAPFGLPWLFQAYAALAVLAPGVLWAWWVMRPNDT